MSLPVAAAIILKFLIILVVVAVLNATYVVSQSPRRKR